MKVGFMSPLKDNLIINPSKSILVKENKVNISIDDKRNSSKILKHKNNNQFKVKLPNIEPQTNKNAKHNFLNIFHHKGKSIFENHLLDNALGTINSVEFNTLTREQNNKSKAKKITNSFKNEKSIANSIAFLDTNFSNKTSDKNSSANTNQNTNSDRSNSKADPNIKIFEDNCENLKRNKSLRVDIIKNRQKHKNMKEVNHHNSKNSFDNRDILNLVSYDIDNKNNPTKFSRNEAYLHENDAYNADANLASAYLNLISDVRSEVELDDAESNENLTEEYSNTFIENSIDEERNEVKNSMNNEKESSSINNFSENYNNKLRISQEQNIILEADCKKENYSKAINNADLNLINDYILTTNEINFINKLKNKNVIEYGSNINSNKTINLKILNNTISDDKLIRKTTEEFGTQYNCNENLTEYDYEDRKTFKNQNRRAMSLNRNNGLDIENLTYSPIRSPKNRKMFNKIDKSNEKELIKIDKTDKLSNIIFNQNINININNFNSSNFINFNNYEANNNLTSFKNYLDKLELDRVKDKYFLSPMNRQKDFRNNYFKNVSDNVFNSGKKMNSFNKRHDNKTIKKTEPDKEKPDKKKYVNKIEMKRLLLEMIFPSNDTRNPYYNPNIRLEKTELKLPSIKIKP